LSLTDDLYREIILEHFRNPRNQGRLEHPTLASQGVNPFCGDEMELTLALQGEQIQDLRVQAKGCSISQASASMMSEAIKGHSLAEAEELARRFKAAMLNQAPLNLPPDLEDLEALEGVRKYPVRIKCAILGWNTLLEGIAAHRKGQHQASHVEGEEGPRPDLAHRLDQSSAQAAALAAGPNADPNPEEQVRQALRTVLDPELNMNVLDLGLIYGLKIQGGSVQVTYTLTSPGCPLGPVIKGQMQGALNKLPWVKEVQTQLVWSPPWNPQAMASDEVKTELGIW
jgi:nitrogen fixation protein NifU and related proteins